MYTFVTKTLKRHLLNIILLSGSAKTFRYVLIYFFVIKLLSTHRAILQFLTAGISLLLPSSDVLYVLRSSSSSTSSDI